MCNIWSDNICSSILRHSSIFGPPSPPSAKINRGYHDMTAWGYEFSLRVPKVSLFNWADMSCSIRVSSLIVSSIKSSVQKTSSLTHRPLAPDRFCKKDENPVVLSLTMFHLGILFESTPPLQSLQNGRPRKSKTRISPLQLQGPQSIVGPKINSRYREK